MNTTIPNTGGFTDSFFLNQVYENQIPTQSLLGNGTAAAAGPSQFDSFWFGNNKTGTNGAAMPTIALANGLVNGFLGFEQLSLGKKQLSENKRQFNLNFGNQAALTNTNLRDRQGARVAFNGSTAQPVDAYMKQNAVRAG